MASLPQLIAQRLGPNGVYKELKPFIPSLQPPHGDRVEVRALCPFHDDNDPSWCWNLSKGVATCHACGNGDRWMVGFIAEKTGRKPVTILDEYCQRLGLPRPKQRTLTVADYAFLKRLPEDFLRDRFGLHDSPDGMVIPYFDESGNMVATRLRRTISKKPRWPKGVAGARQVYGRQDFERIKVRRLLYALEGESDLHTAWYHGLSALALPSASMGYRAFAELAASLAPTLLVIVGDMDAAGWMLASKLYRALQLVAFRHEIRRLYIPANDLSQLHLEAPNKFKEIVELQTDRAPKILDALAEHERTKVVATNTFAGIVNAVLRARDLSPTDRLLLIASGEFVADDPRRPIGVSNSRIARASGVTRRTVQNRLPELVKRGYFTRDSFGLRLGTELVKDLPKGGKDFLPPYPQYSGGSQKG